MIEKMPIGVYFFLLILLMTVSYGDLKTRLIPNFWSLLNLLTAIIVYVLFRNAYVFSWTVFIFPLGILTVGFGLFMLKIAGAGDIKYLSTFYFAVPQALHETFLINICIAAIISILLVFLYRIINYIIKNKLINLSLLLNYKEIIFNKKIPFSPVLCFAFILLGINLWIY